MWLGFFGKISNFPLLSEWAFIFTTTPQSSLIKTSFHVQTKEEERRGKDIPVYVEGSQMVWLIFPSHTQTHRQQIKRRMPHGNNHSLTKTPHDQREKCAIFVYLSDLLVQIKKWDVCFKHNIWGAQHQLALNKAAQRKWIVSWWSTQVSQKFSL